MYTIKSSENDFQITSDMRVLDLHNLQGYAD